MRRIVRLIINMERDYPVTVMKNVFNIAFQLL